MNDCVLDCSFFISSLMPDENASDFNFNVQNVFVPSIFFLECSNVLLTAFKKGRLDVVGYELCIKAIYDLQFSVDSFSSNSSGVFTISNIAKKYDLTSYDASYVELALRLGVPLGTFDKKIVKICDILNVKLIKSKI
jgi:predicted nucleic acid-binding protein